jgi:release factor glutamine methyltransferase
MTLKEVWQKGKLFFKNDFEKYKEDYSIIFEEVFRANRFDVAVYGNLDIKKEKLKNFFDMLERRKSGEPLQYIIGNCFFCGLNLNVEEGIFIPRPDTETLVESVLAEIPEISNVKNVKIVDLCSGTGAVALALKSKLSSVDITAIEISKRAFSCLKKNIKKTNLNVKAELGNIFKICNNFSEFSVNIIVSNPPYIASGDIRLLSKEVKREPEIALNGGKEGLDFYYGIIEKWSGKLKENGAIIFEIGINQAHKVEKIFKKYEFSNIKIIKDFNNIERVVVGRQK